MNQTKRVGIKHIADFSPRKFIDLVRYIDEELSGVISQRKCSMTLKVDGSSIKFGWDSKKRKVFVESSYVGPIYEPGGFMKYASEKFDHVFSIMAAFDDILNFLNKQPFPSIISGGSKKIFAELLYNNCGTRKGNKISFVHTNYDPRKLGRKATIVILKVTDGNGILHPNQKHIVDILTYRNLVSNDDIKIMDNYEKYADINLKPLTSKITNFFTDEYYDLLVSRKKINKERKLMLRELVEALKNEFHYKILSNMKTEKFGTDTEGWVFKLPNGTIFKTVTDEWKARRPS